MPVPNFTNFPSEVSGALLSGSNGLSVDVVTGTPDKIVISAPNLTGVNNISATSITGSNISGTNNLVIGGNAGIGNVVSTGPRLYVEGRNRWDTWNQQIYGDLYVGNSSNGLKMGIALDGAGAGIATFAAQGGANTLNIGAGTTQANQQTITITGGKVGIGTNTFVTASAKTEISDTGALTELAITSPGTPGTARISMYSDKGLANVWRPAYVESGDNGSFTGRLDVYTNGTGIANKTGSVLAATFVNGNVGIGTTSPSQKLSVNGNISADGIVFGSTGLAVTSKTLEDYEEGTWTPILDSGFMSSTSSCLINNNFATYTKIGKTVNLWFKICVGGGTTAGGWLKINNLPFSCELNKEGYASLGYLSGFNGVFTGSITGLVQPIGPYIGFYKTSNGSEFLTSNDTTNDFNIVGFATYRSQT